MHEERHGGEVSRPADAVWGRAGAGGRPRVSGRWLARAERVGALVDAMSWPAEGEAARLDGALRLAAAPVLAGLAGDLARLKALFAGLVADDGRPVMLDRLDAGGEVRPGEALAELRPGRFVAVAGGGGAPAVAATDPFAGLAKRVVDLVLPEMEGALAELTVLLHEHLWTQRFELTELVEQLPSDVLDAIEEARAGWEEGAEDRGATVARRMRHLERFAGRRGGRGDAIADLRRALVRAIGLASGREEPGGPDRRALAEAAEAAVGRLGELLALLEPPSAAVQPRPAEDEDAWTR